MATILDAFKNPDLGSGPNFDGTKDFAIYPPASGTSTKRNVLDFSIEEAGSVNVDVDAIQEDFFNKGLNKQVDINSMFQSGNKIPSNIVTEGIEANLALKNAATNNIVLPNAAELNEN